MFVSVCVWVGVCLSLLCKKLQCAASNEPISCLILHWDGCTSKTLASRRPVLRLHCVLSVSYSALQELLPFWAFRLSPPSELWNSRCPLLPLLTCISGSLLWWFDPSNHICVEDLCLSLTPSWLLPQGFFPYLPVSKSAPVDVFALSHIPQFHLSSQYRHSLLFHHPFFLRHTGLRLCLTSWHIKLDVCPAL